MGTDAVGNPIVRKFKESKLVSISDQVRTLNNSKKTEYRLCSVQILNKFGEIKTFTAQVWEKVIGKLSIGAEYLCEKRDVNDTILLTLTSLTATARVVGDELEDDDEEALAAAFMAAQANV